MAARSGDVVLKFRGIGGGLGAERECGPLRLWMLWKQSFELTRQHFLNQVDIARFGVACDGSHRSNST